VVENWSSIAVTCVAERSEGVAAEPVLFPFNVSAPIVASFAFVTAASVVANEPVPEPVTSPVKVIVWSPVFVPLKFEPVTEPVAATEVGVIAPRPMVNVPVVVTGEPEMETPFDPEAATEVTVPVLLVYPAGFVELYGVNVSAEVTSTEVSVTAPVRVLNDVTPPADPFEANVMRPLLSTVMFAFV
jgi:hypothetical protein